MLRKTTEYRQGIEVAPENGAGKMLHETVFGADEFDTTKVRLFGRMTLEPGASVGPHTHLGENEVYYILSGHGTVRDGETRREVGPGDATLTKHGEAHDIANSGSEPLVFLAIVVKQ